MSEKKRGKQPVRDGPSRPESESHDGSTQLAPLGSRHRAKRFSLFTRGSSLSTASLSSHGSSSDDNRSLLRTVSLPIDLRHVTSQYADVVLDRQGDEITVAPSDTYDEVFRTCYLKAVNVPVHIRPKRAECFGKLYTVVGSESELITPTNWTEKQVELATNPQSRLIFAFFLKLKDKRGNVVERVVLSVKNWSEKRQNRRSRRHDEAMQPH